MQNRYDEIVRVLEEVIQILDSYDMEYTYTNYETNDDVINELQSFINKLNSGYKDKEVIEELKFLFDPTGDFQEISTNGGWENEYLELSNKFDELL